MKKIILTLTLSFASINLAFGAEVGSDPSSLLSVTVNGLGLVLILSCLYFCWRIFHFLKGGELSSAWQILSLAFIIFGLAQLGEIVLKFQDIYLPPSVVYLAKLLSLIFLTWGLYRAKKVLS